MFDWIIDQVRDGGYVGVALLMFGENLFPPIPSELIMPLSGFSAASGKMNLFLVILAGSVGSLLGALFWYFVGRWIGSENLTRFTVRHGRWLTLTPQDIDTACAWFNIHGGRAVFFGRLIPGVRTLISVPAGIARMRLGGFLIWSALGTVLWSSILAVAGYLLEDQYQKVAGWIGPVSNIVIAVLVLWYLYRVATFRRRVPKT
ncbi:MAG: DedA family protein [Rhodospirillales bacterium]|nr:DedA family protein [Rhodospirillales bacterium]